MSQYEIKDPDGQVHRIEAVTHVLDSNGLTLYASAGVVVAIFPKFSWMRQQQAVVKEPVSTGEAGNTEPEEPAHGAEVASPVAAGE
ncbi:hypothetical protein [Pseudomonas sp. 32_A]|uniref:hypothetical protein n=1 Tax=Pseudomonas sp. 32_A TaxID=2813559 RepID=UPI001A9ED022|nr:hypothetical protein [Pseudomonas sp. 32_A]